MNAKQEILDALAIAEVYLNADQPFTAEARLGRIRAILETHTLEPIDDRPFDPTLCGFARISGHPIWHRNDYSIIVSKIENQTAKQITVKELMGGLVVCVAPWPATQSDGERLLRLLGVLE